MYNKYYKGKTRDLEKKEYYDEQDWKDFIEMRDEVINNLRPRQLYRS